MMQLYQEMAVAAAGDLLDLGFAAFADDGVAVAIVAEEVEEAERLAASTALNIFCESISSKS